MNNYEEERSCLVKLYNSSKGDRYLGMGFLADETHIVTCRHVIKGQSEIWAEFCFSDKQLSKVKVEHGIEELDLCDLSFDTNRELSKDIKPARFKVAKHQGLKGHAFQFCFTSLDKPKGREYISGDISSNRENIIILNPDGPSKNSLTEGMSGALVWDSKDNESAFVGMVVNRENENVKAIPAKQIMDYCENHNIFIFIKYGNWHEQVKDIQKSIKNNIKNNGEKDNFDYAVENIIAFRKIFREVHLLSDDDYNILNRMCMFLMDEWTKIRTADKNGEYNRKYNYPSCDDTHSILVEEKIYELLMDIVRPGTNLWTINDRYVKIKKQGKQDDPTKNNDNSLISDIELKLRNRNFNQHEIFLLIASAWLHDAGMIPETAGAAVDISDLFDKHHERSQTYIELNKNKWELSDSTMISCLKEICLLHRHKYYDKLHEKHKAPEVKGKLGNIRMGLLAAYLRLAGALQVPRKTEVKSYMALGFKEPYSRFQWLKSQVAEGSTINGYKATIKLKEFNPVNEKDRKHLDVLKGIIRRELQNELDLTNKIFSEKDVNFYTTAECDEDENHILENPSEFIDTLSSIELFEPTMSPTSSAVVGIVLDQIKKIIMYDKKDAFEKLSINEKQDCLSELRLYNDEVLSDIVAKRSCHVPLKKIQTFLNKVLLGLSGISDAGINDIYNRIYKKIDEFTSVRREIETNLPNVAYSLIEDGLPILLYGYSRCIIHIFKSAARNKSEGSEKIKNTPIYVCAATTKNEYRYNNRLVYNDGLRYIEELKPVKESSAVSDDDIFSMNNIYYVADVCASNLFSKGKISKVLFGANGIDCNGYVHHTLGHLAIADMAHKYGIPVYVIADSLKIGPIDTDPEEQRGNQWLTTDIDKEKYLDKNNVCTYNPRGDCVPPELITAIITEKGIVRPEEIQTHITFQPMIYRDLVSKFDIKSDDIKEYVRKIENPHISDAFSRISIFKVNENETMYRMTIYEKNQRKCIVDYFIDDINNYLFIIGISLSSKGSVPDTVDKAYIDDKFKLCDDWAKFKSVHKLIENKQNGSSLFSVGLEEVHHRETLITQGHP